MSRAVSVKPVSTSETCCGRLRNIKKTACNTMKRESKCLLVFCFHREPLRKHWRCSTAAAQEAAEALGLSVAALWRPTRERRPTLE